MTETTTQIPELYPEIVDAASLTPGQLMAAVEAIDRHEEDPSKMERRAATCRETGECHDGSWWHDRAHGPVTIPATIITEDGFEIYLADNGESVPIFDNGWLLCPACEAAKYMEDCVDPDEISDLVLTHETCFCDGDVVAEYQALPNGEPLINIFHPDTNFPGPDYAVLWIQHRDV